MTALIILEFIGAAGSIISPIAYFTAIMLAFKKTPPFTVRENLGELILIGIYLTHTSFYTGWWLLVAGIWAIAFIMSALRLHILLSKKPDKVNAIKDIRGILKGMRGNVSPDIFYQFGEHLVCLYNNNPESPANLLSLDDFKDLLPTDNEVEAALLKNYEDAKEEYEAFRKDKITLELAGVGAVPNPTLPHNI